MRIWSACPWIAAAATLLACSGCGFKGPLYLPERNGTVITHPAQSSTPAQISTPAQSSAPAPPRKGKASSKQESPAAPPLQPPPAPPPPAPR